MSQGMKRESEPEIGIRLYCSPIWQTGEEHGVRYMITRRLTDEQLTDLETKIKRTDIRKQVEAFAGRPLSRGVTPGRKQSYDHCFNYFTGTIDLNADMEKSCAVLGFYLASWGMYRGSSFLLKSTNSSHLRDVVQIVAERRYLLTKTDLNNYTEGHVREVLGTYEEIKLALGIRRERHITLITKIMAGTFGCIPAFDKNFCEGFRAVLAQHHRISSERLTNNSLDLIAAFYRANQADIDQLHTESRTVAFGGDTTISNKLSRAKIVDMYCFTVGRSAA